MAAPKRPKGCCKDCWALLEHATDVRLNKLRPAPHPGPRCATHHRDEIKRQKKASHERRSKSTYGLDDYWGLYVYQGSRCALCQRATGATRRLSVDHNHKDGVVRGLLCRPCNTLLGHARDDAGFFIRAIGYLNNPPYARFISDQSPDKEPS